MPSDSLSSAALNPPLNGSGVLAPRGLNKDRIPMTFTKLGLASAALVAFAAFGAGAVNAAPFAASGFMPKQTEIVQVQYRDSRRHVRPAKKICRTEVVRRWVNGRPVRARV